MQNELAFDTLPEARDFMKDHNAAIFTNPTEPEEKFVLDCKAMNVPLNLVFEEKYRKVQIKGAV